MRLKLGGQGNFRHQDDHIPAGRQGLFCRPQIDFGFTAAGDPVQQEGLKSILACIAGRMQSKHFAVHQVRDIRVGDSVAAAPQKDCAKLFLCNGLQAVFLKDELRPWRHRNNHAANLLTQ